MVSRGVKSSSSVSASYGKKQDLFSARSGYVLTEDVDGVVAADKRAKLSADAPYCSHLFTQGRRCLNRRRRRLPRSTHSCRARDRFRWFPCPYMGCLTAKNSRPRRDW